MSRIRGKNTRPELVVRSVLRRLGCKFALHMRELPGSPDIVLRELQLLVFVHGCFWHRHRKCKFAYVPKTRVGFWKKKFRENVARDLAKSTILRKQGWHVRVIWECETKDLVRMEKKVQSIIKAHTKKAK